MKRNKSLIRKMAKSYMYQTLYSHAKEMNIKLFDNERDLSKIQIVFLGWLGVYDFLNSQIQMGKLHISKETLDNDTLCYSSDTEILTDQGWKYFKDLNKTEKVATLNPETEEIEYQAPIAYTSYFYQGKMYQLKSGQFNFCVTPKHKNFIGRGKDKTFKWVFRTSNEIYGKAELYFKRTGIWKGEDIEYFYLEDKKIPMDLWLEFLGWYLSEGCVYKAKNDYRVIISQSKKVNLSKWKILKSVLIKMPFNFSEDNKGLFYIYNKQLYNYLKQFGKAKDKFISNYIKNLNPRLLRIFIYNYFLGDGNNMTGNKRKSFYITTYSLKMRDDLMEIGFKAGYAVMYLNHREGWVVSFLDKCYKTKSGKRNRHEEWINYNDYVYTLTVLNYHTLFVRRNGKTVWSGNCDSWLYWWKEKGSKTDAQPSSGVQKPEDPALSGMHSVKFVPMKYLKKGKESK